MLFSLLLAASFGWSDVNHPIPDDKQTIVEVTQTPQPPLAKTLPTSFDMLVWNVHKGADGEAWAKDLRGLSKGTEFVLLQEGMRDSFMPKALGTVDGLDFWMATSFSYRANNDSTGVISGFKHAVSRMWFHRSPGREPFLQTPKMALLTTQQMSDGRELLLINIHAINFVANGTFREQILDLIPEIQKFQGPVIFAGDFNTWNPGRIRFLTQALTDVGMQEVVPLHGSPMRLDHIFERGCPASHAQSMVKIATSDHAPLLAHLDCSAASPQVAMTEAPAKN